MHTNYKVFYTSVGHAYILQSVESSCPVNGQFNRSVNWWQQQIFTCSSV